MRRTARTFWLKLAAGLACAPALALPVPDAPAPVPLVASRPPLAQGLMDDWRWVRFDHSSGLPSEQVQDLIELPSGEVWVHTVKGLAWYDGFSFHPVGLAQGLPDSGFLSFNQDLNGGLWAIYDSGVYAGGHQGFRRLPLKFPGASDIAVLAAPLPGRGMLVVARGGFCYLWTGSELRPLSEKIRALNWVGHATRTYGAGSVWLSAADGVHRLSGTRHELAFPAPVDPVTGERRSVHIYAADETRTHGASLALNFTPSGLTFWDWSEGKGGRLVPERGHDIISGIAIDRDGERLVAQRDGKIRIGRAGNWTSLPFRPAGLRNVFYLRFRANGDLWSATGHGLYLWRRGSHQWTQALPELDGGLSTVHDILFHSDGSLWLATMGGLAVRSPRGDWRVIRRFGQEPVGLVTGVKEDLSGNVWVVSGAGFGGAWRWDGKAWSHFGSAHGLTDASIHRIFRDRSGVLWFLSTGGASRPGPLEAGAYRMEGGRFERWAEGRGVVHSSIMSMAEAPDGTLYFGTRGGLSRLRAGQWRHWTRRNLLSRDTVFAVAVDASGRVWFTSRAAGLGYLDSAGRPRYVTSNDGLAGQEVWEMKPDQAGRLWVSTQSGLSLLENGHWTRFLGSSGISNLHLWPIATRGDEVCVGSLGGGLYCANTTLIAQHRTKAVLEEPEVRQEYTIFRWRAFSEWGAYPGPEILTRFRLDGGAWSRWGDAGEAVLAGLPAGSHTFTVQSRGPMELRPSEAASHSFEVPQPFLLNPLFFVPVLLLLSAVAVLSVILIRRKLRYQREIARSEERFRSILDHSTDIVSILDGGRRVSYSNRTLQRTLGYEPWEKPNLSWDLIHPDDRGGLLSAMDAVYAQPRASSLATFRIRHRDGSWRWQECVFTNLLDLPGINGVVSHSHDVTERREFEQQLAEAKRTAEQASLAKSDFLATMSHEIRTPMNGILGMCALLEGTPLDESKREFASTIRGSAQSLLIIVNDVLDLSRIEAGKMVLANEPFSLNTACREAVDLLWPRAIEQKIALLLDYPRDTPRAFTGDVARIRQILLNLLGNAVKFTHEGEVRLRVRLEERSQDQCRMRVEVSDTGIGISPEVLPTLFEKFTQADSSNTRRYGGSGLGLSICRSLVERLGGKIGVDSEPGTGSCFWFTLPLTVIDSVPETARRIARPGPLPHARILVVEDNRVNQRVAAHMLSRLGLEIELASNGREAVERASGSAFDLILMDCHMPEMNGYEATAAIRGAENGSRRTPIVALTANAMEGERDHCLAAGMDDYLSKPIDSGKLAEVLSRWLANGGSPNSSPTPIAK